MGGLRGVRTSESMANLYSAEAAATRARPHLTPPEARNRTPATTSCAPRLGSARQRRHSSAHRRSLPSNPALQPSQPRRRSTPGSVACPPRAIILILSPLPYPGLAADRASSSPTTSNPHTPPAPSVAHDDGKPLRKGIQVRQLRWSRPRPRLRSRALEQRDCFHTCHEEERTARQRQDLRRPRGKRWRRRSQCRRKSC